MDYVPTTWPGARLPHLWVRRGEERLTLLDLPQSDRFVLLTTPTGLAVWRDATAAVQRMVPFQMACLSIGPAGSSDLIDEHGAWPRVSEIEPTGTVLVRPDGHVSWRAFAGPDAHVGVGVEHRALGRLPDEFSRLAGLTVRMAAPGSIAGGSVSRIVLPALPAGEFRRPKG